MMIFFASICVQMTVLLACMAYFVSSVVPIMSMDQTGETATIGNRFHSFTQQVNISSVFINTTMDTSNILEIRRLATLTTDPRVGSWLLEQASFLDAINARAAAAAALLPVATPAVAAQVLRYTYYELIMG